MELLIKKIVAILLCALFAIFSLAGCSDKEKQEMGSKEKDIHPLYEKVMKERNRTHKTPQEIRRDEQKEKRGDVGSN